MFYQHFATAYVGIDMSHSQQSTWLFQASCKNTTFSFFSYLTRTIEDNCFVYKGYCKEFCVCAAIALVSSVCVLKPSVCSEMFCYSWPKAVYQLDDHLMDDVGGKSVYVACYGRLVEYFTDVILPFQSFCISWPF